MRAGTRDCGDAELFIARQKRLQFQHILRKLALVAGERTAQGTRDALIRPRRASPAQLDTPGKTGLERHQLLGNTPRRMVRQHEPSRADTVSAGRSQATPSYN